MSRFLTPRAFALGDYRTRSVGRQAGSGHRRALERVTKEYLRSSPAGRRRTPCLNVGSNNLHGRKIRVDIGKNRESLHRFLTEGVRFSTPFLSFLATVAEIVGHAGKGGTVYAADHEFASLLDRDQSSGAKLLDVKGDRGVDFFEPGDVAADLAQSRSIHGTHRTFGIERDGAAAATEKVENFKSRGIPQCFVEPR
jgi:hypothetical protein